MKMMDAQVDEKYLIPPCPVPGIAHSYLDLDRTTYCPRVLLNFENKKEEKSVNDAFVPYGSNYLDLRGTLHIVLGK